MVNIPEELKYADSHEWVALDDDIATIGISDHAQAELTDIVFVEVPELGATFQAGDQIAVVESVKAAGDIYAPVSGTVVEVNGDLESDPGLINTEPYEAGWIYKVRISDAAELENLMNAEAYQGHVG
ncbi:MAG: glycine cleavage system protein GcvH [Verrucomicrobiota bacterium]